MDIFITISKKTIFFIFLIAAITFGDENKFSGTQLVPIIKCISPLAKVSTESSNTLFPKQVLPSGWSINRGERTGIQGNSQFIVGTVKGSSDIQVFDRQTGSSVILPKELSKGTFCGLSEDGQSAYVVSRKETAEQLVRVDLASGKQEVAVETKKDFSRHSSSPNKEKLLFIGNNSSQGQTEVTVIDLKTKKQNKYNLEFDAKDKETSFKTGKISDDGSVIELWTGSDEYHLFKLTPKQLKQSNIEIRGKRLDGNILSINSVGTHLLLANESGWSVNEFDGQKLKKTTPLKEFDKLSELIKKQGAKSVGVDWFSQLNLKDSAISDDGRFVTVLASIETPNKNLKPKLYGDRVVSGSSGVSEYPIIIQWDLQGSNKPILIPIEVADMPGALSLSAIKVFDDGGLRVAGATQRDYFIWDSSKGLHKSERKYDQNMTPWDRRAELQFSSDGSQLLISDYNNTSVFDVDRLWASDAKPMGVNKIAGQKPALQLENHTAYITKEIQLARNDMAIDTKLHPKMALRAAMSLKTNSKTMASLIPLFTKKGINISEVTQSNTVVYLAIAYKDLLWLQKTLTNRDGVEEFKFISSFNSEEIGPEGIYRTLIYGNKEGRK